ncbi:MAG: carboxypeptidase-like regulatory domain-containing protein, partial [Bacteroidota bacterium]
MNFRKTKKPLSSRLASPGYYLVFFFALIHFFNAYGQEDLKINYRNTSLKSVLLDLEERTDFLFSYSDETVANKTVNKTADTIGIEELLQFLGSTTGLVFEQIGENQIIISRPDNRTSVCGYLFDGIAKTPLPYATIIIKGTTKGYTTDENGYFSIENETIRDGILVQYIGYTSRLLFEADFDKDNCKNLFLNPQAESLSEVIVKSYLIKGIDKNRDGSLTLKSKEQGILPGLVESDVLQSAQWAPGITSINETVSDIQIRGGAADQNLILYDGIKMYNTGHFFGMISVFNPNITTDATIFKGGASPEYGDRIAGVVDIKGETQVPDKTIVGLGLNGTQADAYVKTRLGETVGLIVSGRRSYADIDPLGTPTFDAISEKVFQNTIVVNDANGQVVDDEEDEESLLEGEEVFSFYDANVKLIIKPSKNDSIYFSGLLTSNDLNFSLQDDENLSRDILVTENQGASFEWSGLKGSRWHHSLSAYFSDYESTYRNRFLEEQNIEEENLRSNTVTDYGMDARIGYDFNRSHSMEVGYQAARNEVFYQLFRDENGDDNEQEDLEEGEGDEDEGPIGVPENEEERDFNERSTAKNTTHSIYGAYSYRPQNRGLVRIGIRASNFQILEEWFFEPRLNVEYPVSPFLRLKLTGEKRYQTLSQLVEFDDTRLRLQSGIWTLTDNDQFPVLESDQFSAGFLLDMKGWTVDVDAYLKKIDGLTSFTNGFTSASEEYSQGTSDVFGLDFLVKKQLG